MATQPSAELLAQWTSTAKTRDGSLVRMRPLRPEDGQRELDFIASLSDESRYFRLMTPLRFVSAQLLAQLMDIDYDRRMALVAIPAVGGEERFVGIARYGETDKPDSAELGISVTDSWQGRGLAQLLVAELMRFARWRGFRRIEAIVLPDNQRMLSLATRLGFTSRYDPEAHLVRIERALVEPEGGGENCVASSGYSG
jgi:acetyltransferase